LVAIPCNGNRKNERIGIKQTQGMELMSTEQKDEVVSFLERLVAEIESSRYGEGGQHLDFLYQAINKRKKEIDRNPKCS
jgi:hypothetical protein